MDREAMRESLARLLHERFCMSPAKRTRGWDEVDQVHKDSDYPDADAILALIEPLVGAVPEYGESVQYAQSGVDVHGGLRVRLEYEKATRTIAAKNSAEAGVDVFEDVKQAIVEADRRAGFLRTWLKAALAQEREG